MKRGEVRGWREVEGLLEAGLTDGTYTAAVVLAGRGGELRFQAAVGRLSAAAGAPRATMATVFDLASLTKPLATALALIQLVARGRLHLDMTLGEALPVAWLPAEKKALTLVQLLAHRAGLPAWEPFYLEVLAAPEGERSGMLARLAAEAPLTALPGAVALYSDLGFMLLQAVAEHAAGEDLDRFCRREIYGPLGLDLLGFCPRRQPGGEELAYAATEPGLIASRGRAGEVHDENAWAAGGIAGHAGLFGRGEEVWRLVQELYRGWRGEATLLGPGELVAHFLAPVPGAGRAMGFDLPAALGASCGRYFGPRSVGHLGFTGTSCWLDPESGQAVVLLTNRVHLGRENAKIRLFRPRLHEAVSRALGCTGEVDR